MAYASPSTQPTGTLITSTMWAQLVNNDKFFHGPPAVRVERLASQTVGSGSWTAISFSSKAFDTNSMFATTGTKITCKTAGKFQFNFVGGFISSNTGTCRGVGLRTNSTGLAPPNQGDVVVPPVSNIVTKMSITQIIALTTGQFVEAVVFSNGSSNGLKTSTGSPDKMIFSALWISS